MDNDNASLRDDLRAATEQGLSLIFEKMGADKIKEQQEAEDAEYRSAIFNCIRGMRYDARDGNVRYKYTCRNVRIAERVKQYFDALGFDCELIDGFLYATISDMPVYILTIRWADDAQWPDDGALDNYE